MEYEKKQRIYRVIMLVVLTAVISFIIATIIVYNFVSTNASMIRYIPVTEDETGITSKMQTLKDVIDSYYIGEYEEEDMLEGSLKGYVAGVGDEYTEYLTKEEWESLEEDTIGNYTGIGIYIMQTVDNEIMIIRPMKDSPAEKAGLQTGDIITKVNDVSYTGEELSEASNNMKGEIGTSVKIEIKRDEEILEFTIVREEIDIYHVESEVLDGNIGYLAMSTFDQGCSAELEQKYQELKKQNIKGLIIDLRNNTGGIVTEATDLADLFIEKDKVMLQTKGKKVPEKTYTAQRGVIIDIPTVVLVNEYSASSTEIFVGALKDYQAATIVGTKTYGKGVIQNILEFQDGSAIKVTSSEFLTPNGNKINDVGIEPDVLVELPEELKEEIIVEKNQDTQLQKAIEILNNN